MSFSNWLGINRWEETKRFMGGGEEKKENCIYCPSWLHHTNMVENMLSAVKFLPIIKVSFYMDKSKWSEGYCMTHETAACIIKHEFLNWCQLDNSIKEKILSCCNIHCFDLSFFLHLMVLGLSQINIYIHFCEMV